MLLSARILENYVNANTFDYATEACWTEGDAVEVYFQLVDMSKDRGSLGFNPSGRRYMPADGATLVVTVDTLDNAKKLSRDAEAVDEDGSIWKFTVLATDTIRGTAHLRFALTEGSAVVRGLLDSALSIQPAGTF